MVLAVSLGGRMGFDQEIRTHGAAETLTQIWYQSVKVIPGVGVLGVGLKNQSARRHVEARRVHRRRLRGYRDSSLASV